MRLCEIHSKLGVCLATSGPGGIHLLNGLYDAKLDCQPVLALTGLHYHDLVGTLAQQDVELDKLFVDACVFNERVMGPNHVENLADQACRTALAQRGVAHITIPVNIQEMELDRGRASERNRPHHTSDSRAYGARLASDEELRRAADVLNAGKKIAILIGQGALHHQGAAWKGRGSGRQHVRDRWNRAARDQALAGGDGELRHALHDCNIVSYIEFYPKPGKARAVQLEVDPRRVGLRYPVEVGLVSDSRATLQDLIPLLKRNDNRKFLETAQEGMRDWWQTMEVQGTRTDRPMTPQVLAWELGKRLAPNAIVSTDSGTITTWWARHIKAQRGQMFSCSGNLATMACGLPYTIAAQVAYPDRQCVAFMGDGGFSLLMAAEMATAVKYKLPIKVFVVKNNTLGQIKWEQMVFLGIPEYGCELQRIDFAAVARACGAAAFAIDDPATCGSVLDQALAATGPVLVEATVDAFEPPMPTKVTLEQAAHFAKALAKGEPNRKDIALTVLEDKVKELVQQTCHVI
jgi:pyruvate dehydrogenase (quinone)/pyruvate oxidase